MKRGIAFFDFDGTITTKDTLLEFIKYAKGHLPFYTGFALNSPYLIAYKLKLISNQFAKEKVLAYFFKNMSTSKFQEICDAFAKNILPSYLRPKALEEIANLQRQGVQIVIVSASPENWIRQWASSVNAALLATNLQVIEERITGKIEGCNCYGEEKVRRIKSAYDLDDYTEVYAYGDTSGDKPMLSLAGHSSYKPFRDI